VATIPEPPRLGEMPLEDGITFFAISVAPGARPSLPLGGRHRHGVIEHDFDPIEGTR
jgi:hypothetical protein